MTAASNSLRRVASRRPLTGFAGSGVLAFISTILHWSGGARAVYGFRSPVSVARPVPRRAVEHRAPGVRAAPPGHQIFSAG
ncbi:hypothetical protein GCM10007079_43850 [Nocardiopsis terrae]|nr:hypothetical protein GCM10007079_43850 [Nocardiopsis terrae]